MYCIICAHIDDDIKYKYAAKNGHLDCFKYAHENGCCDLNCDSMTWCEYRCDTCWEKDCNEHNAAESFKKYALEYIDILYEDVIDIICSFVETNDF